jgi:archaellum biogenesis protein FlaJ (TadC family)
MKKINLNIKSQLQSFSYGLFHDKLPEYKSLREALLKTGITESYEMYVSFMFFLSLIISIIAFFVSIFLHSIFFNINPIIAILPSSIATILTLLSSFLYWISYPILIRKSREGEINSRLHFVTGYASILASYTNDLVEIFKELRDMERSKALKSVYNTFLKYVLFGGKSIKEALEETAKRCPSDKLASILTNLSAVYVTTGNIAEYLSREARELINLKMTRLQKLLSQLSVNAELYVGLIINGPLIFLILFTTLGSLMPGALPISTELLIILLIFLITPSLSVFFLAILISIIGREEI